MFKLPIEGGVRIPRAIAPNTPSFGTLVARRSKNSAGFGALKEGISLLPAIKPLDTQPLLSAQSVTATAELAVSLRQCFEMVDTMLSQVFAGFETATRFETPEVDLERTIDRLNESLSLRTMEQGQHEVQQRLANLEKRMEQLQQNKQFFDK